MNLQETTWPTYYHFSTHISYQFSLTCFSPDIFIPRTNHAYACLRTFAFAISSACIGFPHISQWFPLSFSSYSFSKSKQVLVLTIWSKSITSLILCSLHFFSYSLLVSNVLYISFAYLTCFLSSLEYEVFEGRVFCLVLVFFFCFLLCFVLFFLPLSLVVFQVDRIMSGANKYTINIYQMLVCEFSINVY